MAQPAQTGGAKAAFDPMIYYSMVANIAAQSMQDSPGTDHGCSGHHGSGAIDCGAGHHGGTAF